MEQPNERKNLRSDVAICRMTSRVWWLTSTCCHSIFSYAHQTRNKRSKSAKITRYRAYIDETIIDLYAPSGACVYATPRSRVGRQSFEEYSNMTSKDLFNPIRVSVRMLEIRDYLFICARIPSLSGRMASISFIQHDCMLYNAIFGDAQKSLVSVW